MLIQDPYSRPRLVILGAMKCGSTTLFDILTQHPNICGSEPKEPKFFADSALFAGGELTYGAFWPGFDEGQHHFLMEATTDYTKRPNSEDVAPRILNLDHSKCRYIYIVRDPLERIESHVRHVMRCKVDYIDKVLSSPETDLDQGVPKIAVDYSRFAYQLDPYRPLFEEGRLLILRFEDLLEDQQEVINSVTDFLDLSRLRLQDTNTHSNRSDSYHVASPLWEKMRSYGILRRFWRAFLPQTIRNLFYDSMKLRPIDRGRSKMTEMEAKIVLNVLEDDIARLASQYKTDIVIKNPSS